MSTRLQMPACLFLTLFAAGCGEITLGPRTERKVVITRAHEFVGRVAENVSVDVQVKDDSGEISIFKMDIGGCWVASPDLVPDAPKGKQP